MQKQTTKVHRNKFSYLNLENFFIVFSLTIYPGFLIPLLVTEITMIEAVMFFFAAQLVLFLLMLIIGIWKSLFMNLKYHR